MVPLQVLPEQRPAQRAWTGLVTSMACALLAAGRVDAVLCVASAAESPKKRLEPRPILARSYFSYYFPLKPRFQRDFLWISMDFKLQCLIFDVDIGFSDV